MSDDIRKTAEEIFEQAVSLPADERDTFLKTWCTGDSELRGLVDGLFQVHRDREQKPHCIDHYRILEKIGEGGFGEVFVAEQTEPVKRRVALKVLKAGLDTKAVLARFEAERQALALMDHPGIARVFDAGQTEQGRPYFVMDLILGVPITEYCDRHELTMKQRLDLYIQVCQAIQHAHTKGVIHRDVKPSNILVTLVDGVPVPKVIDFGIAKATVQPLTEKTLHTMRGQIVGTPAYMSPEQAETTGLDVDTRTDVYSLGVLLYELLTGTLPFETTMLMEAGLEAMQRILREREPQKPSTRISSLGEAAGEVANRRRTAVVRLTKDVRGELDWITMRALEKDPARRYQSASAIAEDIERYRRDEAILAGPPSTAYRLKKLVVRHKVPVAFAAIVMILLLGFGISMSYLRDMAVGAREEAQTRAQELEQVTDFQASMLSEIDLEEMGRALVADLRDGVRESFEADGISPADVDTALAVLGRILGRANATDVALGLVDEQVLGRSVEAIDADFSDQPLVQASLQQTVATTYRGFGLYLRAMPLQESALDTRRRILSRDHPSTLSSIGSMGLLLKSMSKFDEAVVYYREAVDGNRRTLGDDHPQTLLSINNMGVLLKQMGKYDEALVYYREALVGRRRVLGVENPYTLTSLGNLGALLGSMGRFEEALDPCREVLAARRRLLGDDHRQTLTAMANLGVLLKSVGRFEEALPYYREALESRRRILGDNHPKSLQALSNMGALLSSMGKPSEALACYRDALEGCRQTLGDDHRYTLNTLNNIAMLLASTGKFDEAFVYSSEALEGSRRVLGDDHMETLKCIANMGTLLLKKGKPAEAKILLATAEAAARRIFSGGHSQRLGMFLFRLGQARAKTGEFEVAQAYLIEAHAIIAEVARPDKLYYRTTLAGLVELYEAWHTAEPGLGYDGQAAAYQAELEEL